MNKNFNQPMTKRLFIIYIVESIVLPPVMFKFLFPNIPIIFAPILSAVMVAYIVYAYRREKKADVKAESQKESFMDDSYFRCAEWREKYLKYRMKHEFEKPKRAGMKADLTERYCKMASLPITLFGLLMLAGLCCGIMAGQATAFLLVGGILVSALIIYVGAEKFLALPVKKLYSRSDIDIGEVENSYENGQMLTHKHSGINIGSDYTVIYGEKSVDVVRNSDIRSVTRHITRLKHYQDTLYAGEEYIHKLRIDADREYFAELNEYQVEMAINELDHNNQIVT
ncbi:MAG TPA: hypothetical protein RWO09_03835 [Ruminococcus sp.]